MVVGYCYCCSSSLLRIDSVLDEEERRRDSDRGPGETAAPTTNMSAGEIALLLGRATMASGEGRFTPSPPGLSGQAVHNGLLALP